MNRAQLFYLLLFISIVHFHCGTKSGCPEVKNKDYVLSQEEKNGFPFSGVDTMAFMNQSGRLVKLAGVGKQDNFNSRVLKGAAPVECPQLTVRSEFLAAGYRSSDTLLSQMDINLVRVETPTYNSTGKWIINAGYPFTFSRTFADLINDSIYYDTVYVNGNKFNCIKVSADTGDINTALYFNHHYGVLRLKLPSGQVWYRQ